MRLHRKLVRILAVSSVLACGAAVATQDSGFAALEGVDAQALTSSEMQAVAGELNAYDIAASLLALATRAADPRVAAGFTKLANETLANAAKINATFAKFKVLTPCTSSLCP